MRELLKFWIISIGLLAVMSCSQGTSIDRRTSPNRVPKPIENPPVDPIKPTPPPADNDKGSTSDQEYLKLSKAIVQETNNFRASQGEPPLGFSPEWSFAAYDWSRKQAKAGNISHDGFPLERIRAVKERFPTFDTTFQSGGENVLWNIPGNQDIARFMVNQWANSPGHRENMLRGYSLIGAGGYQEGNRWYGTQIFILK